MSSLEKAPEHTRFANFMEKYPKLMLKNIYSQLPKNRLIVFGLADSTDKCQVSIGASWTTTHICLRRSRSPRRMVHRCTAHHRAALRGISLRLLVHTKRLLLRGY